MREVAGMTYFFRSFEQKGFHGLQEIILNDALQKREKPFSIAIAGCSTGEEVYSYAMLCSEHGFREFKVHGYDVHETRIRTAKKGRCAPTPFNTRRLENPKYLTSPDTYFRYDNGYIQITRELRAHTDFFVHDLTKSPLPQPYDLIICTAVMQHLIYQGDDARKAATHLVQSLKPQEGILAIDHTIQGRVDPKIQRQYVNHKLHEQFDFPTLK